MVHTGGMSHGTSVGAGIGTFGLGVGGAVNSSSTVLGNILMPPMRRSRAGILLAVWMILMLFSLGALVQKEISGVFFGIFAVVMFVVWRTEDKKDTHYNRHNYPQLLERYERSRVCQRCGIVYDPWGGDSAPLASARAYIQPF